MQELGVAQDDEGRWFTQYRCAFCREEFVERVRPPQGWREEIRAAVRAYRARGAA